ncbi:MAG: hypothetical protein IJV04_02995, partial [Lachnospiraceae bacterium]|nr:hypothetical protein [Lachnospiraceae bacterium]
DEKVAWEEKQAAMSGYLKKQVTDICDVLLLDIYGRYLWIVIEMFRQHEATGIFDIKIEFPGHSIIAYLPDYYQQEDREGFLERYLAIFQTIYEDRSREIMGQAHNYDVESADADALYELASWIGVIRPRVWPEDRLRRFLREGVDLFRMRGTRQGLSRIIELYTGEVPYIVEARELYPFRWREAYFEELVRLYGEDENQFMILLPQSVVNTPLQQKIVRQLINEMRPAHIEYHLVLLVPYIFAGRYSYLGINTVLGEYSSLKLDGQSAVSFTGLKGGTE